MKEKTPLEVSLLEEEPTSKLKEDFRLKSRLLTGFTLIELMLVLIIVGMLALIGGVKFGDTVRITKIRKAKAEMQAKAVALRSFHMDCGQYPFKAGTASGPWPGQALDQLSEWHHVLVAGTTTYLGTTQFPVAIKYWAGPYLPKAKLDPWGKPYLFRDYSDPEDARITALLCTGKDRNPNIEDEEWTPGFKKLHPPDPRDGISIYYPDPGDKNTFDIIYWME